MNQERILKVILGPHISEKSTSIHEKNSQVVFRVHKSANKLEVKNSVENLFKVKVDSVRILNKKGKEKRNRFGLGRRIGIKKAYVRLKKGYDIDFSGKE
jgi:large subunit ribosomal protein L23